MARASASAVKLLIVFSVTLSLSSLPGLSQNLFRLPSVYAFPAPAEHWYPAGPAMDTERLQIGDAVQEQNCLQLVPPCIDLTDSPLPPPQIIPLLESPSFYVTSPVTEHDYFELEFNLANNYWGINMNFGNDPNGVQLRQGVAHLINKNNFITNDPTLAGTSSPPIDNPVPSGSSFGTILTTPNPCGWDTLFPESGPQCVNGAAGGTAYNCSVGAACPSGTLGPAPPHIWQAQIGSLDFCAGATHIMNALNNGVFISSKGVHLNSNCELLAPFQTSVGAGWPSNVTSNTPNIFVRFDDPARSDLGLSYAQEICALWTGSYNAQCAPFFSTIQGTIGSFCGFIQPPTGPSLCWWIYTGGFGGIFPFDQSLYFGYNSRFVSGVPGVSPPCAAITPSSSPSNFIFLCNPAYDTASAQMEFAPSLPAAFTSATTAMNVFGQGAYTIPVWTGNDRFGYLSNWQRVINGDGAGIPNFFTWLDAYSPNSAVPGTIRQGFAQTTRSLSPYIATTTHDFYILNNVFDSPLVENPSNNGQLLDWMTRSSAILSNAQLGYTPPAGTVSNIRLNLRSDIFWQDGRQVTAWDVKFAWATLLANGALAGNGLAPMVCTTSLHCTDGITVPNKSIVDIHLTAIGPFTKFSLGTTFVFPGRYWSANCPTTTWDMDVAGGSVPDSCMTLDSSKAGFAFDPIANHILIGSGPWACTDVLGGTGALGFGCSDTGTQNPPVSHTYTLTRYGKGQTPGSSAIGSYFRSSGSLALYLWSGDIGDSVQDSITLSEVAKCLNAPLQPVGSTSGCGHWQQGIGAPNGYGVVTANQANIVQRFIFLNWVSPFTWAASPCSFSPTPNGGPIEIVCTGPTNLPDNMATLPGATLYEGVNTLRPAAIAGCNTVYNPTSPSSGGYDC